MKTSTGTFAFLTQLVNRFGEYKIVWCLVLLGGLFRVIAGVYYTRLGSVRAESAHIALSLATQGEYSNAFEVGTGPTAHVGPLVPLLMAAIYYVFGGDNWSSVFFIIVISSIAVSLTFFVVYRLFDRLGVSNNTRLIALIFVTLVPVQLEMESAQLPFWEAGYATLVLALLLLWTLKLDRSPSIRLSSLLAMGAAVALLEILNPAAGLSAAGALGLLLIRRTSWTYRTLVPMATLAFFLLATAPWQMRNQEVLGAAVRLRTSMGYSLAISYYDGATKAGSPREANVARFKAIHPHWVSGPGLQKLSKAGGEVAYSRQLGEEAKRWIMSHPIEAAAIALQNVWNFYFPPGWFWDRWSDAPVRTVSVIRSLILCAISVFAFVTLLWLLWKRQTQYLYLLIVVAAASVPYVAAFPLLRYRYPISTITVFLAATGLAILLRKVGRIE